MHSDHHLLRELRDIVLDCTVASDEPLNIVVDSYSICQKEELLELQRH